MIRAGFTINNPLTGSRTVVLESDAETAGASWLLEVYCQPKATFDILEHYHLSWTEEFEIVSGSAFFSLDGTKRTLAAGERVAVSPGQRHIHPWNAGETELIYRQRSLFQRADPAAVQDVLGVFATIAGLAREQKVDQRGLPKHPLQLAATMRTLVKHQGYDASIPKGMQDVLTATLGRLAERLGYRGVYERYLKNT